MRVRESAASVDAAERGRREWSRSPRGMCLVCQLTTGQGDDMGIDCGCHFWRTCTLGVVEEASQEGYQFSFCPHHGYQVGGWRSTGHNGRRAGTDPGPGTASTEGRSLRARAPSAGGGCLERVADTWGYSDGAAGRFSSPDVVACRNYGARSCRSLDVGACSSKGAGKYPGLDVSVISGTEEDRFGGL